MSSKKVLLVDDDPNVLNGYHRLLRKRFDIETALCSEEALTAVNFLGPFAVIVSDMNMPRENGVQLLKRFLEETPDSSRIMLTGNADQQTAARAINESRVFRFLNKPCDANQLAEAIEAGIEYHRLRVAEHELLEQTVRGSIGMLTEILSVMNPTAFGRASRLRQLVAKLAKFVDVDKPWECEMAAMLSEVGCITVPTEVLEKAERGEKLSADEAALLAGRYKLAHDLIRQVPRLENVAQIVAQQDEAYAATLPAEEVSLSAHLLRVARDYDTLIQDLNTPQIALRQLTNQHEAYHPEAIAALQQLVEKQPEYETREVGLLDLEDGWLLASDIKTTDGVLLVKAGLEINASLRLQLQSHANSTTIVEPLAVLVPIVEEDSIEPGLAITSS